MKFIDSHAHLTAPSVYPLIDTLLTHAQEVGVSHIINICTDKDTLEKGLALRVKYPFIYNSASTTPHDVDKEGEQIFPLVEKHARAGDLIAIGETGLDYHYFHSTKEAQQTFYRRYLRLALECALPVVIHCRDAFQDFFSILDEEYRLSLRQWAPGVLHCFTGTPKEAEEVIKRGWYLSLSGIVTFKKSDLLREVAKFTPLDQLLIETDTPYLAPKSKRGKQNEPAYVIETAEVIAQVKNISLEELAHQTSENAKRLFSLTSSPP